MREWRGESTAFSVYSLGEIEAKRNHWAEANAYFQRVYVGYQKFLPWVAKAYIRSGAEFRKTGQERRKRRTLIANVAQRKARELRRSRRSAEATWRRWDKDDEGAFSLLFASGPSRLAVVRAKHRAQNRPDASRRKACAAAATRSWAKIQVGDSRGEVGQPSSRHFAKIEFPEPQAVENQRPLLFRKVSQTKRSRKSRRWWHTMSRSATSPGDMVGAGGGDQSFRACRRSVATSRRRRSRDRSQKLSTDPETARAAQLRRRRLGRKSRNTKRRADLRRGDQRKCETGRAGRRLGNEGKRFARAERLGRRVARVSARAGFLSRTKNFSCRPRCSAARALIADSKTWTSEAILERFDRAFPKSAEAAIAANRTARNYERTSRA